MPDVFMSFLSIYNKTHINILKIKTLSKVHPVNTTKIASLPSKHSINSKEIQLKCPFVGIT